jgi:zinc transporter ZupT/CRP-like cAMP-binding protein
MSHLRQVLLLQLVQRLWRVPLLSGLTFDELKEVIQNSMYRKRFLPGDIVLSSEASTGGLYFIVTGSVRVEVHERDDKGPMSVASSCSASKSIASLQVAGLSAGVGPGTNINADALAEDVAQRRTASKSAPFQIDRARIESKGSNGSSWQKLKPRWSVSRLLNTWGIGVNQIFGDMGILSGSYLTTVVVALQDTKVLMLPCHEVGRLIAENNSVKDVVLQNAIERLNRAGVSVGLNLKSCVTLMQFQPCDTVFSGVVDETTPLIHVVVGSVEVKDDVSTERSIFHVNHILCGEHLFGQSIRPFSAIALVPTLALVIDRSQLTLNTPLRFMNKSGATSIPGGIPDRAGFSSADSDGGRSRQHSRESTKNASIKLAESDEVETICIDEPAAEPPAKEQMGHTPSNGSRGPKKNCLNTATVLVRQSSPTSGSPKMERTLSMATSLPTLKMLLAELAARLGWDNLAMDPDDHMKKYMEDSNEDVLSHLVTDLEIEEHQLELTAALAQHHTAQINKNTGRRGSKEAPDLINLVSEMEGDGGESVHSDDPEAGTHSESAAGASRLRSHDSSATAGHELEGHSSAAIMVWLGILIDAVPESIIIGILINKSAEAPGGVVGGALPFIIGVFLSNLPESMGSAGSMKAHGMKTSTIMLMWFAITVLTAFGAALGAQLFPSGSGDDLVSHTIVASVEGIAAGAMLTMIAQTMMPEAFEQGGDVVGLSCLAGFLCAAAVKLIPR